MGMFETYDNVHHQTAPFALADSCTECHGRGYTAFPISVGTGDEDYSPCPLGCEVPEEQLSYYYEREAECALDDELQHAFVLSLRPVATIDPFLILSNHMRLRGFKPWTPVAASKHPGTVSSDYPLWGLIEQGAAVHRCRVPAYLVGKPVSFEGDTLVVQYEYLGSRVSIRYARSQWVNMRFAHAWDSNYATDQIMA